MKHVFLGGIIFFGLVASAFAATAPEAANGIYHTGGRFQPGFRVDANVNSGSSPLRYIELYRDGFKVETKDVRNESNLAFVYISDRKRPVPGKQYTYTPLLVNEDGLRSSAGPTLRIGIARDATHMKSSYHFAIAFAEFADAVDVKKNSLVDTATKRYEAFFGSERSLKQFIEEVSYGKVKITGEIFGWYTLPRSGDIYTTGNKKSDGTWGGAITREAFTDLLPLIQKDGICDPNCTNTSVYDEVMAVYHGWGSRGSGSSIGTSQGYFIHPTTVHEFLHDFNLLHAGKIECKNVNYYFYRDFINGDPNCSTAQYADTHDVMGVYYRHPNAYHKERLGFFDAQNIREVSTSGEYTIDLIEEASNAVQVIKIPFGADTYYYLEYRRPVGIDGRPEPPDNPAHHADVEPGVYVRLTSGLWTGAGNLPDTLVASNATGPIPFTPSRSFSDPFRDVRIEVREMGVRTARVQITFGASYNPQLLDDRALRIPDSEEETTTPTLTIPNTSADPLPSSPTNTTVSPDPTVIIPTSPSEDMHVHQTSDDDHLPEEQIAPPISRSALSETQIIAILNLLSSFGAETEVIANVRIALAGGTPTALGAATGQTTSTSCVFDRDLSVGVYEGADIQCLQQYLNSRGFVVAGSGPGSPGNESTFFGERTRSAVARWQAANSISPARGYFGPSSRAVYQAATAQ